MAQPLTSHKPTVDGNPSGRIWHDFNIGEVIQKGNGYGFHDDFENFAAIDSARYQLLGDTLPAQLANFAGGAVNITSGVTIENESILGGEADAYQVRNTTVETGKALRYETRKRVTTLTAFAFAVGLTKDADVAADFLTDATGAIAGAADFIGFRSLAATPTQVDFVWQKASAAIQLIEDVHTLVADEFVNLGFFYDPDALPADRLKVYVNNVHKGSVTAAQIASATLFPVVAMTFIDTIKTTEGVTKPSATDWIRIYQSR